MIEALKLENLSFDSQKYYFQNIYSQSARPLSTASVEAKIKGLGIAKQQELNLTYKKLIAGRFDDDLTILNSVHTLIRDPLDNAARLHYDKYRIEIDTLIADLNNVESGVAENLLNSLRQVNENTTEL